MTCEFIFWPKSLGMINNNRGGVSEQHSRRRNKSTLIPSSVLVIIRRTGALSSLFKSQTIFPLNEQMNVWMEGCKSVSHRMSRNWLSFWTRNVSVCKQHPSQQEFLSCHVLSLSPCSSKQGCCYEFPPLVQQNIRLTAMLFNLPKQLTLQRVITIFQSF